MNTYCIAAMLVLMGRLPKHRANAFASWLNGQMLPYSIDRALEQWAAGGTDVTIPEPDDE
mgnify:CR=1 FL=1